MMERKNRPDCDGSGHYHGGDGANSPRVYEGWAPISISSIILLVAVDAFGASLKGAQRWLDLGIVRFQPSWKLPR